MIDHLKLAWMNYQISRQPRKCSDCGHVCRISRWQAFKIARYWFRTWERARKARDHSTVKGERT